MIELPEATAIAQQMQQALTGRTIIAATRGNTPHKFAFYSGPPEFYASTLPGLTIGDCRGHGWNVLVEANPDWLIVLGCGGERILLHEDDSTLPKKHHLLLQFADGACLTVTVQGWGNALLLRAAEAQAHPHVGPPRVSPTSDAFTLEHLQGLLDQVPARDSRSVKFFLISEPGIWGVGNGYLQDILFRARIHPRQRVRELGAAQVAALHAAIQETLRQAVAQGGRDSELDLYGRPGGYRCLMDKRAVGQPCPRCGTPIEKAPYLGGAVYTCPQCQA